MPGTHTVEVTAFDGVDISDVPVPFGFWSKKKEPEPVVSKPVLQPPKDVWRRTLDIGRAVDWRDAGTLVVGPQVIRIKRLQDWPIFQFTQQRNLTFDVMIDWKVVEKVPLGIYRREYYSGRPGETFYFVFPHSTLPRLNNTKYHLKFTGWEPDMTYDERSITYEFEVNEVLRKFRVD
jgi:hypothetical protein